MNIVLLEPEIPHNTGAIGRTCSCTNSALHLIRPLGFSTDEKHLRRSGLDYWHSLNIVYHDSYEDFVCFCGKNYPFAKIWYAETKGAKCYSQVKYGAQDFILFGNESKGIPEPILRQNLEYSVRVPMASGYRSLNLSVAVGVVLYEALRQNGFQMLKA